MSSSGKQGIRKRLYAILWVDDYGSFPLSAQKMKWYENNAGPLSLGVEIDERFPRPFRKQLGLLFRSKSSALHYSGHHYHPMRFNSSRVAKKMYDQLGLRYLICFMLRVVGAQAARRFKTKQAKKIGLGRVSLALGAAGSVFLASVIVYAAVSQGMQYLLWFVPYSAFLVVGGTVLFVHLERHWVHDFSDVPWNLRFLTEVRRLLEVRGESYTPVIRHGLNTPPAGSMGFYLREMHVLADASSVPTTSEGEAGRGDRRLHWRIAQPYYASLRGDYDVPWDGLSEQDRGILELPVNLGNIAEHGFAELQKETIERIPDGGLVSAFMHAWDDFSPIKDWVRYLKENYDVRFLPADEYAHMFMRLNPRPVLIDPEEGPCWSVNADGNWAVRQVNHDTVSVSYQACHDRHCQLLLKTNTGRPIPAVFLRSFDVKSSDPWLDMERTEDGTLLKDVQAGAYRLTIEDAVEVRVESE